MSRAISYALSGALGVLAVLDAMRGNSWWVLGDCVGCFANLLVAWSDE